MNNLLRDVGAIVKNDSAVVEYIIGCNELHHFLRIKSARVLLSVLFVTEHEYHYKIGILQGELKSHFLAYKKKQQKTSLSSRAI